MHLQCVLIEGIAEAYYLSDLDISKDANLQLTIILRTLQIGKDFFDQEGRPMPDKIRLHTDNAVAEGKNQIHMKACALLVHRQWAKQIIMSQFRVGHTHWKVGQRFSEIRKLLSGIQELQTPDAYANYIRQNLTPRQHRGLHVEILHGVMDFKSWVEPLPVKAA